MAAKRRTQCSVCGSSRLSSFFQAQQIPVLSCALWPSPERAQACLKRDIELAFCPECGLVENAIFDAEATEYSELYENALHYSKVYQVYAREEAERLVERIQLRNKAIIEVGCGDGMFSSLLCELGDNRAVGFDPSFSPDKHPLDLHPNVRIIPEYYSGKHAELDCDLVTSRHVLEHIPAPRDFMRTVRDTIGARTSSQVFFEVPNALYLVDALSLWDVIYEHCSYFTAPALRRLFEETGFTVVEVRETFRNQCLTIEAQPGGGEASTKQAEEVARIGRSVGAFADAAQRRLQDCRQALTALRDSGNRVALWGTGARAVIYLNMTGVSDAVGCAVDINPRKHGSYLPGTAQQILPPERLRDFSPDVVLLMNPIYQNEVARALTEAGVKAELRIV